MGNVLIELLLCLAEFIGWVIDMLRRPARDRRIPSSEPASSRNRSGARAQASLAAPPSRSVR